MKLRSVAVGLIVSLAASIIFSPSTFPRFSGLSIDLLGWMESKAFAPRFPTETSPSAIIAIDEETYRTPPFRDIPKVMWTKQVARVLREVLDAGAVVVGFDVIFPTSVEKYIRGFDREFLVALHTGAEKAKVVLGKAQHQAKPVSPHPGYSFAVGHNRNIRLLNLHEDPDGTIRRIPLLFRSGERFEPSFALELAARALGRRPERLPDGSVSLGGYLIPGSRRNAMAIRFEGGRAAIPSYSFADLFACAEKGDRSYFQKHFRGKVVLIGTVLDLEDRVLSSMRFFAGPEGSGEQKRCALPVRRELRDERVRRDSVPGVYVHAAAVNNLLRKRVPIGLKKWLYPMVALPLSLTAACLVLLLSPLYSFLGFIIASAIWTAAALSAFHAGWIWPLVNPLLGGITTGGALLGYRVIFLESEKRFVRNAFGTYLSPRVVKHLMEHPEALRLGGERKEITAFFSDIAGFTSTSEAMPPEELVLLLNEYLSEMTDVILAYDGTVDKFEGDAIVAFFGAPHSLADHAARACLASLDMQSRLRELPHKGRGDFLKMLHTRIGLNSGSAIVGNMGSRNRFDYTMMGDTVNTASRLEGTNKEYGTSIIIGPGTYEAAKDAIEARELDLINVVGRAQPIRIYELMARKDGLEPTRRKARELYVGALGIYREREFQQAFGLFEKVLSEVPGDGPAQTMLDRCVRYLETPPPSGWNGVHIMQNK